MAGNNYFRFKQFTIYQHKAAMKVGIDGVLLGAWAALGAEQQLLEYILCDWSFHQEIIMV